MKIDLRNAASDCFDTFPFPNSDPRSGIPQLEAIGERLYTTRAAYLVERDQGLTTTYIQLNDPTSHDAGIANLRELHEQMNAAVVAAYGWNDTEVPPFCPASAAEHNAVTRFAADVIDRLFALNAERKAEERDSTAGAAA